MVHNLLHLISNTGPAIECKLLQILVGLITSPTTVPSIVAAIKSSSATVSLVQFIEVLQNDLRVASIKLLRNLSTYMGQELADALCGTAGQQLGTLIKVVLENIVITEEQAATVGLLDDLPERDMALISQMLGDGAFRLVIPRITMIRQGETRGSRFVMLHLEGLVRVLSRVTYVLVDEPDTISLYRDHNLAGLFTELLQANVLNNIQMVSAIALENLSQESKNLTKLLELPKSGFCLSIFPCLDKPQHVLTGLCRIHSESCSQKETFCLLEGQAVEKLVALVDHTNEKVVEASVATLSTLLDDGVDLEQGVMVLCEMERIKPILDVLLEKQTENLQRMAIWVVERLLHIYDIAQQVSGDPNVNTGLVDSFQHGNYRTRQITERALKHVDKIPNFSGVFSNL